MMSTYSRWDAAGSVGEYEELSEKKRIRRKRQRQPRGNAAARYAPVQNRYGCATIPQKRRRGVSVVSHGHVLMENRTGLPVAGRLTKAITAAECQAAIEMLEAATKGRGEACRRD